MSPASAPSSGMSFLSFILLLCFIIGIVIFIIIKLIKRTTHFSKPIQQENRIAYCNKCGSFFQNNDKFCSECGTSVNVQIANSPNLSFQESKQQAPSNGTLIGGIIMLILGIIGAFYSVVTISSDTSAWYRDRYHFYGYDYIAPLSSHETTTIVILVLSGIMTFIGLIVLLVRRKH